MRALYGYKKKTDNTPYVVIYDNHHEVGEPIKMKNFNIISEREVTEFERKEIVSYMSDSYRIYHYDSIEKLVEDELNALIITPTEVIANFRENE